VSEMGHLLQVTNAGKAYRQYRGIVHRLWTWFGRGGAPVREHWALQGVHFQVSPGESVGIIGRNGAGKSTLLKLITGTLVPTDGRIERRGRVASILELGLGFNPAVTGRQNAEHSLSLLGHTTVEVIQLLPAVEAFAEVGDYFDQPVRVYSSGMQMRLAFAVVTACRPDLLIVDEALAVGDAYFQHKCFDRIRDFRSLGTSLLIVSHDRAAILGLCDRALVLHQGTIVKDADPATAIDYYNALLADPEANTLKVSTTTDGRSQVQSGNGHATVMDIALVDTSGKAVDVVEVGQSVELRVQVECRQALPTLVLGILLRDRLGQSIYGTNSHHLQKVLSQVPAGRRVTYRFAFQVRLGPGDYAISTALTGGADHLAGNFEWRDLALVFEVVNRQEPAFAGTNWLDARLELETVEPHLLTSTVP
jgi:lipopolysaccharide transport system ATP-binding protein